MENNELQKLDKKLFTKKTIINILVTVAFTIFFIFIIYGENMPIKTTLVVIGIFIVFMSIVSFFAFKFPRRVSPTKFRKIFLIIGILMIITSSVLIMMEGAKIHYCLNFMLGLYFICFPQSVKKYDENHIENKQIKQKIPVGIILILAILGLGAISWLATPREVVFIYLHKPIIIGGIGSIIISLIISGILVTIFYGIVKKFEWARKLAIGWYAFVMAKALINTISLFSNEAVFNYYYQEVISLETNSSISPAIITGSIVLALILSWTIGLIVITYLIRKKDFFVN